MKNMWFPYLYEHVDLSIHNRSNLDIRLFDSAQYGSRLWQASADDPDQLLNAKQQMFLRAISKRPELGRIVKTLVWTFVESIYSPKFYNIREVQFMWRCLENIDRVQRIDLGFLGARTNLSSPPALFVSASFIRLFGRADHRFVSSMLRSSNASQLLSLELDNLFDLSHAISAYATPKMWELPAVIDHDDDHVQETVPRLMRGHILCPNGNYTMLRHLSLRNVGQSDPMSIDWLPEVEEILYREWASLIKSVKPTLRNLIIEQGVDAELRYLQALHQDAGYEEDDPEAMELDELYGYGDYEEASTVDSERPLHTRFIKFILPVLLSGTWPKLEKLSIIGVYGCYPRWQQDTANYEEICEALNTKFGSQVTLKIEMDSDWSLPQ
ncbi:MAG: hypothetical protein M1817_004534 [Caeruleum heppii]|nr:MAG: hypothetical protein M1817_004534 [Caeruleum heppii]